MISSLNKDGKIMVIFLLFLITNFIIISFLTTNMKKQITNYALDLDENTSEQFEHCTSQDFVIKASLMPDAHSGYVAPIGSVLVTKNYIVPAWVGYDIGCGMIACKIEGTYNLLEKLKSKLDEIYKKVNEKIPMGEGHYNHISNITKNTFISC